MSNIPRCQYWDCGHCYYHGFLKANSEGSSGCKGYFDCDVYLFENKLNKSTIKETVAKSQTLIDNNQTNLEI